MSSERSIGYLKLLRQNQTFRRIWMGNVVSQMGDWFTSISLMAMLLEFTGKGESVALFTIAKMAPGLLMGPIAGVVADRLPRKAILITCDILRALVVLGYLFVRSKEDAGLVYAISVVQTAIACFFLPAQDATVAATVGREERVAAFALTGITWSSMLCVGAFVGGVFAELLGREAAFVLNSATYLLSAYFISRATVPAPAVSAVKRGANGLARGVRDVIEGVAFVVRDARVRRLILVKGFYNLSFGGAVMLYSVFGDRVFRVGSSAATGIGLIYAVRGVGALVGPTTARLLGGDSEPMLERWVARAFFLIIGAYCLFTASPWLGLALVPLVLVHMGASIVWAFSTSLLSLSVPEHLRGRVFAADGVIGTVAQTLSTLFAGYALDRLGLSPRVTMFVLAMSLLIPATLWLVLPQGRSEGEDGALGMERGKATIGVGPG